MKNHKKPIKEQEKQEKISRSPALNPVLVEKLIVSTYKIPTQTVESDGTLEWDHTTLVLVEIQAANIKGIGYTYADVSTGVYIQTHLKPIIEKSDALNIIGLWQKMHQKVRNLGYQGIAAMAISAVDNALWDYKAKFLGVPLAKLLGLAQNSVKLYASGGFTNSSIKELQRQVHDWAEEGFTMVKIKIGTEPDKDPKRVQAAKTALGESNDLFVDANGAYSRKQALLMAEQFSDYQVKWFEEPVPSDDLEGLRLLRDRAPAGIDITAGEYGYDQFYFKNMLSAGAVDVLQADATRCSGITGFLKAANIAEAFGLQVSAHTAPAIHLHACCSITNCAHIEYFFDHYRIENMLFEGAAMPEKGNLTPDLSAAGTGLIFKKKDAERFKIS